MCPRYNRYGVSTNPLNGIALINGCDQSGNSGNGTNIPEKINTNPNVSCVIPSPAIVHSIVTFRNVVIALLKTIAAHIEIMNAAPAATVAGGAIPITMNAKANKGIDRISMGAVRQASARLIQ